MSDERLDLLIVYRDFRETSIQRINLHLTRGLRARGHRVGVVGLSPKGELRGNYPEDVPLYDCDGKRPARSIGRLAEIFRRTRPRAILSAHAAVNIAVTLAARRSKCGARVVLGEHNQPVSLPLKGRPRSEYLSYRLIRFIYPFADRIVCVSHGLREDFIRYTGLDPARFEAIYNPVIMPEVNELAAQAYDHPWARDTDVPLLAAVGRLDLVKNYEIMLRALVRVRRTRDVRLIILGEGIQRANLERLIAELGLSDCVAMRGFDPNPFPLLRRADLFIQASEREALSNVIVEALACGTTVVTTDCRSGPREILQDGALGTLVPVGDEAALANAILHGLDNPLPPEPLIARAQDFTVDKAVEAYEKVLGLDAAK